MYNSKLPLSSSLAESSSAPAAPPDPNNHRKKSLTVKKKMDLLNQTFPNHKCNQTLTTTEKN